MALDGVGGRGNIPAAYKAQNQKQEKDQTSSSVIKSAKWVKNEAGLNDPVGFIIELSRKPLGKTATVEIVYHGGAKPHTFDNPIVIQISSPVITGNWATKAPRMREYTKGYFTFQVKVDNEMKASDHLRLTDNPVAKAVRRINSDGWDGP